MRIYYMDSLRSVLIILGIFLHAANIYHVDGTWLISDPQQHPIFNQITYVIHMFRLPAFFILSGYFSLFIYQHYGLKKFLIYRVRQIVIPVVVIGLLVNTMQGAVLYYRESALFAGQSFFDGYLLSGLWISHLWFLVFLMFYITLFGLLMPLIDRIPISTTDGAANYFRANKVWVVLLFPLYFIAIKAVVAGLPWLFKYSLLGFWNIDLFIYAYYFAFGVLLHRHEGMLKSMVGRYNRLAMVVVLLCWWLITVVGRDSLVGKVVWVYGYHLASVVLIFLIWRLFQRLFDKPSRWIEGLSKSCYTIYLFHHLFVIALGVLLMPVALPPAIKFTLVTLLTLFITTLIHFGIVERYSVARLLLNGKLKEKPRNE